MAVSVLDLWLPILLSAVAVFVLAFLAWVVLPHHNSEIERMSEEAASTASAIRCRSAAPPTS